MTYGQWLERAYLTLKAAGIETYRLDAELILANTLKKPRTHIHAYPDKSLPPHILQKVAFHLDQRSKRKPLAYILGYKEFYGREFIVTQDILIPRPETEKIIEILKDYQPQGRLLDIGTGSGIIGITVKLELPELNVTLSDISPNALIVARKNAKKLGAKPLRVIESDLLSHWLSHISPKPFNVIVANLPYVGINWERSPETEYEPSNALFADNEGLALIEKCISQSAQLLSKGGLLILEADPRQHDKIIAFAKKQGFSLHVADAFIVGFLFN